MEEKKDLDFVEVSLLEPIYRSTVIPLRKGEIPEGRMRTSKVLLIAVTIMTVVAILSVPVVMLLYDPLQEYFRSSEAAPSPASILERAVVHKDPRVLEFMHRQQMT